MDFGGIQESVILSIMFWPAEIGLNYPLSMSIRGCVAPRPSQILFYFWRVYISLVKLCVWDFEKCFRTKCYLSIPNTSRRFICYLPIPPTLLTSLLPNTFFFYFHFSSLCSRERLPTASPQSHSAQQSYRGVNIFNVSHDRH